MHRVLLDELGKAGLIDWSRVSLSPTGRDSWTPGSFSRSPGCWTRGGCGRVCSTAAILPGAKSEPEEGVADDSDDWWNPKWVPLTYSGSGDHHCVDLAPTPDREVGQIILMYHDVPTRQVVARSFGAWLEAVANDLEAGRYVYDEDRYRGLVNKDEL